MVELLVAVGDSLSAGDVWSRGPGQECACEGKQQQRAGAGGQWQALHSSGSEAYG